VLGAILVPLALEEATRYIPPVQNNPGLVPALQWVVIGLLIVVFLWFRPQGILPERRRIIVGRRGADAAVAPAPDGLSPPSSITAGVSAVVQRRDVEADSSATDAAPGGLEVDRVDPLPVRVRRPPFAGEVILSCAGLSRSFDGVRAVDEASMSFRRGRLTGIIGPNGAGKSTALAMLAGTLSPTAGRIEYRGRDVTSVPAYRRARLGLVRTFQLASEFKRLTVMENLIAAVPDQRGETFRGAFLGRRYWGAEEREAIDRAEAMLERFGLFALANRYAGELSGGQRRLVEIMRALMAEPDVLLLDEPMAGVHPRLAHEIGMQLVALSELGVTIVMVEHELSIMDEFCDPVIVMADGRVLAEGTMAVLRSNEEVVEAYLVG
jgi:branched-chain amino acid transport system ATP-binding protein/branched-chain amino acid transport system permease protein